MHPRDTEQDIKIEKRLGKAVEEFSVITGKGTSVSEVINFGINVHERIENAPSSLSTGEKILCATTAEAVKVATKTVGMLGVGYAAFETALATAPICGTPALVVGIGGMAAVNHVANKAANSTEEICHRLMQAQQTPPKYDNLAAQLPSQSVEYTATNKAFDHILNSGFNALNEEQEFAKLSNHIGSWLHDHVANKMSSYSHCSSIHEVWKTVSSNKQACQALTGGQLNSAETSILYGLARSTFYKHFKFDDKNILFSSQKSQVDLAEKKSSEKKYTARPELKSDMAKLRSGLAKQVSTAKTQGKGVFYDKLKVMHAKIAEGIEPAAQQVNKKLPIKSVDIKKQREKLASVDNFCESINAYGQGAALLANISKHPETASRIISGTLAGTQIIRAIHSIALNGLQAGNVGLVLGGINSLFSLKQNKHRLDKMTIELLCMISRQVSAMHEDMLKHFGQVYKALGFMHQDIIREFCELHKHIDQIDMRVARIQEMLEAEGHSVNAVGAKVDELMRQSTGYWKKARTQKWKKECNTVKQEKDWGLTFENYKNLHNKLLLAITTLKETTQAEAEQAKITPALIAREFNSELGSAEADINLLVKYAQTKLRLTELQYQVDPLAWESCTQLLIEIFETFSDTKEYRGMPKKVYDDFQNLLEMGNEWLAFIESLRDPKTINTLFTHYQVSLQTVISEFEKSITNLTKQTSQDLYKEFSYYETDKITAFNRQEFSCKTDNPNWFTGWIYKNARKFSMPTQRFSTGISAQPYCQDQKKQYDETKKTYVDSVAKNSQTHIQTIDYYNQDENLIAASPWLKQSEKFIYPAEGSPYKIWLPMPQRSNLFAIPESFLLAESLGLGHVHHQYHTEGSKFIITLSFITPDKHVYPYAAKSLPFTPPTYFSPDEAIWHFWQDGTYPDKAATIEANRSRYFYSGNEYHDTWNLVPNCVKQIGQCESFSQKATLIPINNADQEVANVRQLADEFMQRQRKQMNSTILKQAEDANTATNPLAAALLMLDAQAKVLKAFLSILFRKSCFDDPVLVGCLQLISDKMSIIDYLRHYEGQSIYIPHYLRSIQVHFDEIKKYIIEVKLKQADKGLEYPLVEDMLVKLREFIAHSNEKVVSNEDADPSHATSLQLSLASNELLNTFVIELLRNATIKENKLEIDLSKLGIFRNQSASTSSSTALIPQRRLH